MSLSTTASRAAPGSLAAASMTSPWNKVSREPSSIPAALISAEGAVAASASRPASTVDFSRSPEPAPSSWLGWRLANSLRQRPSR
jgi:hypothetical protein